MHGGHPYLATPRSRRPDRIAEKSGLCISSCEPGRLQTAKFAELLKFGRYSAFCVVKS